MQTRPIVYGAAYSTYVQTVRLTLWAKDVPYELIEVDVFNGEGSSAEHLSRHPFGRVPAFEHEGFKLYETAPICRYIDETFGGPKLQPDTPSSRAVMGQAISILDNYAYRSLVWGIYVERISRPRRGAAPDLEKIETARQQAKICLTALDNLAPTSAWLTADDLTLADLHAAPMFALFIKAPDALELMAPHDRLIAWWKRIHEQVSPAQVIG